VTASHANRLRQYLLDDAWSKAVLHSARSAAVLNGCIAGGFVRNLVWDRLHAHTSLTRPRDIDVVYFDPAHLDAEANAVIEARLKGLQPDLVWEASNQAVHRSEHGVMPPASLDAALATFPETVTSIGVRLEPDDTLTIIAPFGLDDLFGIIVRRNPASQTRKQFRDRVVGKRILELWPKAAIIDE
jgi:hypothetical protein